MRISGLLREKYADFSGPLAAEKLAEPDQTKVSAESVHRLQIDLGLYRPKKRHAKRVFQRRERRPRFRELIQIGGSPHKGVRQQRNRKCISAEYAGAEGARNA
jgi:hypothetical protein